MVRGEFGCPYEGDCELGAAAGQFQRQRSIEGCLQVNLLAAKGDQLLRDGYSIHGGESQRGRGAGVVKRAQLSAHS